jgi:hypothetical protein
MGKKMDFPQKKNQSRPSQATQRDGLYPGQPAEHTVKNESHGVETE